MTTERGLGPVRSLVLKAGTAAGVVAVLALPVAAEAAPGSAERTATTASAPSSGTTAASRGRIVDGAALSAAVAVAPAATHAPAGPPVTRSPLASSDAATDLVTATSRTWEGAP